jgi:ferric-dicitrate binding protein FerR (iron transport regulator)
MIEMPEMYNNVEELMIRYLQQDISENELGELDRWLQESPEHRDCFFQLKSIYDSTKRHKLVSEEEVEKSWRRMQRKLAEYSVTLSPVSKKKQFLNYTLRYVAVGAIAVLLGVGIGEYRGKHSRQTTETPPVTYNEISVQKGGKPSNLVLSDGSKVLLNAATTLRYPTNFSGEAREVFLNGEAYFEVAKDAAKPFVVRLKQQNITVHGTNFNIEAYRDEAYNIVTLLSGSISLETLNRSGAKIGDILLIPGQKALFDSATELVSVEKVDASLSNAWIKGEFKFKDEPLALIAKRLENYYDVRIHLDGEGLKKIKFTGTFSLNQNIREVLRIVNHENQFLFQQTGNEIHIKSKKNR